MRATLVSLLLLQLACSGATGGGSGGGAGGGGGGVGGGSGGGGAGAGAGGTGGGGSGTGGGTAGGAPAGGSFFSLDVGFSHPSVVPGADGVLRIAYATESGGTVRYGECRQSCGTLAGWTFITLAAPGNGAPVDARLAQGSDGRLHVVYELFTTTTDPVFYLTCAASCLQPASWSGVELTQAIGNTRTVNSPAPITVDAQNRVSFISGTRSVNGQLRLNSCASSCTSEASWQSGVIRTGANRVAMVSQGTTQHLIYNDELGRLHYRFCSSSCHVDTHWQDSGPLFAHSELNPTALAVTAQGALRVAYNQGVTAASEPPAVKAQDNRLLVWECSADCLQATSWAGVLLGASRDGERGVSLAVTGAAAAVAVTTSSEVLGHLCAGSCADPGNWRSGVIDDTTTMETALDPYAASTCSGGARPVLAAWSPNQATVSVTSTGGLLFVHAPNLGRRCPGAANFADEANVGRFILSE